MKKLSIVTINYNQSNALDYTLDSIKLSGLPENYGEVIVIDGGSSDNSTNVIEKYSHIVTYSVSEPDNGIFDAMNKGLAKANGEFIIFMNSGDAFCRGLLSELFLESLRGDLIYGDYYLKIGEKQSFHQQTDQLDLAYLLGRTICHQSLFMRTELCKEFPFRTDYSLMGDWIQLFEIMRNSKPSVVRLNMAVCIYDGEGQSETNIEKRLNERRNFLENLYSEWELNTLLLLSRMRGRTWYQWVMGALDRERRNIALKVMSKLV
jgi:glycosyltransferase involved in cell wall biosynthesis